MKHLSMVDQKLTAFREPLYGLETSNYGLITEWLTIGNPSVRDPDMEEMVLDHFENSLQSSTGQTAAGLGINNNI